MSDIAHLKCSEYANFNRSFNPQIKRGDTYTQESDPSLLDLIFHLLSSKRPVDIALLSEFYRAGVGVVQNEEKATELLTEAARFSQSEAENLALYYESKNELDKADDCLSSTTATKRGLYIKACIKKAKNQMKEYAELIEMSAIAGYPDALVLRALHCLGYEGVCEKKDYRMAADCIYKSPDSPLRSAILALLYFRGDGVKQDLNESVQWASSVINKGDTTDEMKQYNAVCRQIMQVQRAQKIALGANTLEEASQLMRLEIKSRSNDQEIPLPYYYQLISVHMALDGLGSVGEAPKSSYEEVYSLCSQLWGKESFAPLVLSYLSENGLGCTKSLTDAIKYMKMHSSEKSYDLLRLEYMLESKNGSESKETIDLEYIALLAQCPGEHAQLTRANLLFKTGDYQGAYEAYEECTRGGFAESSYSLGCMLINGQGCERDIARGCEYLEDAQRYSPALFPLGLCMYDGVAYKRNVQNALALIDRSYKKTGNKQALKAIRAILSREGLEDQAPRWNLPIGDQE